MKTAKVGFQKKSSIGDAWLSADSYVVYQYTDGRWTMSRAFPVQGNGRAPSALWDHIANIQSLGYTVTIDKEIRRKML